MIKILRGPKRGANRQALAASEALKSNTGGDGSGGGRSVNSGGGAQAGSLRWLGRQASKRREGKWKEKEVGRIFALR